MSQNHSSSTDHDHHGAQTEPSQTVTEAHVHVEAPPSTEHADHGGDHQSHEDHSGHEELFRRRFWVCLLLSLPVLLYSPSLQNWLGLRPPPFPGSELAVTVLSLVIFIYGGLPFLQLARPEIRQRRPGMMTLISLAISVALLYSLAAYFFRLGETFFWELVTLIDIMLLGHWLEMRSVRGASAALDELGRLLPDTAERIEEKGQVSTVSAATLALDDLVLVRPGAAIPADGTVDSGASAVDESMITGESSPVPKEATSKVIAGSINGDGSLRVRVTAVGDATALAGIMRLVREAQTSQSRTQVLADRAAGWLFYVAIGVAAITAVAWTIAIGFRTEVLARVATVLVIACPHALGLAVPLVVAISTTVAARAGILVRDRLALERARGVDTVVFDKTGTLTLGERRVVAYRSAGQDLSPEEALGLAAAVEADSEHSIARAIAASAEETGVEVPAATEFAALPGRGARAHVSGRRLYVGGHALLAELGLEKPQAVEKLENEADRSGWTVAYLADDETVHAGFALADALRPESLEAVQRLQKLGMQVAMLTGDKAEVAADVAQALGIDEVLAEVLPENKEREIRRLQESGRVVAMVGDGVNDAPALARADVGIAIGSGTDVAAESAGIILVRSDPGDVVRVMDLSRAAYRKMVQNLAWAAGYNIIALPLAAGLLYPWGILLSPAVGALLMSLSTIIVALNAQTLRRWN